MNNAKVSANNAKVSASILSADFADLKSELKRLEEANVDMVHIDVMDGHFVPNITIGVPVVRSLRKYSNLIFDVHLMIAQPNKYIESFVKAGADILTIHYESEGDTLSTLRKIKKLGCKCGLSIKPSTPVNAIEPFLNEVDLVLVMTVNPGFGGQKFMVDQLEKVRLIKSKLPKGVMLEVDGGINADTATLVKSSGANILVSGSYLFNSNDMPSAVKFLQTIS